jgi:hypothetical protein
MRYHLDAASLQQSKEPAGISDRRNGVHRSSPEILKPRATRIRQVAHGTRNQFKTRLRYVRWQMERPRGAPRGLALHKDSIDGRQSRDGFTKRAGRQQQAVSEASRSIDHGNFVQAPQAKMLQTVVGNNDIAVELQEQPGSRYAIRVHDDRADLAPLHEQCLVTHHGGIAVRQYAERLGTEATAVAPADDARPHAVFLQAFREPEGNRRFTGTAGGNVADNEYRPAEIHRVPDTAFVQFSPARGKQAE